MPKVPPLDDLQRRRSEKWYGHADGVIAATVAEMDFELAEPIAAALHDAVSRSDLGYVSSLPSSLGTAFAGFAQRRLDWKVDPDRVTLVPDVMVGLIELCRVIAPGGSIGFATAAYPPFLEQLPAAGFSLVPMPLLTDGSFDLDRLTAQLRDGLDILILANPHNPTGRALPVRRTDADRGPVRAVRRLGAGRRDPCAPRAAGRAPRALARSVRCGPGPAAFR